MAKHTDAHLVKLIDLAVRRNLMNDLVQWAKELRDLRGGKR